MKPKSAFVCFGEINTPFERITALHDEAVKYLKKLGVETKDAGIVIDDAAYKTADEAAVKILSGDFSCLIVCVAGWVPTHAVIRVTDKFRHIPMLLWGLCGWKEKDRIITTAPQAGTTAIRPAFEALKYRFKFVYNVIGAEWPGQKILSWLTACQAAKDLRSARVGTMGYRDMLLYGTQYEQNSMREIIGVEVEPFEMLEMVQNAEKLEKEKVDEAVEYVQSAWVFEKKCDEKIIRKGVEYALAVGKKIGERGWKAVTLIDVDGMKKLLGFPPAMVFMLLNHYWGVQIVPENDIMGAVTQLMLSFATGQVIPYLEYYEFFEKSVLMGVPDFVPEGVVEGKTTVLPAAFGLLSTSLLNVSKVKTGLVTCARLIYKDGKYCMHIYRGNAETPPPWNEFGWAEPAPQLPSLLVTPDSCTVEEFAQKVSSQHVLVSYGDNTETIKDLCGLLGIDVI